jgi:hypothetical protein
MEKMADNGPVIVTYRLPMNRGIIGQHLHIFHSLLHAGIIARSLSTLQYITVP